VIQIQNTNPAAFGFSSDIFESALRFIEEHAHDSVWLDEVEKGSSTFRGKLIALGLAALMFVGGDIVRKTEHYNEFTTWSAKQTDQFIDWLVTDIRKNKNIDAQIVGDRVRIVVIPSERDRDIKKLLPPR
jgi:hypothetical protein